MADQFCGQCGHRNDATANFCSSCGAPLDTPVDERTATIAAVGDTAADEDAGVTVAATDVPAGMAVLVVKRGPGAGSRFLLDTEVVSAGRHPDSHIFLDDVTVSRRHAEIHRRGDGHVVRDVGSLNGTYLNRERIEEDTPLANGDELQIGRFRLVFLRGETR